MPGKERLILPGDLIIARRFLRGEGTLYDTYMNAFNKRVGTLRSYELCLVAAIKPTNKGDRLFVLTEHGELGWQHRDDFLTINESR